jgi:hypothetical protein
MLPYPQLHNLEQGRRKQDQGGGRGVVQTVVGGSIAGNSGWGSMNPSNGQIASIGTLVEAE